MPDRLEEVPLSKIKIGERFRKDLGDIQELADAIIEKGVIQPVTLDTEYNLQAGGRRVSAAQLAKLESIPALIRESLDELDLREIELMENVYRKDMTWVERSQLTKRIHDLYADKHADDPVERTSDKGWSNRKTAGLMGKSLGLISKHLQLAEAIEAVPALADCKTEDEALKLMKRAQKHVTVKALRKEQDERMADIPMVRHADTHFNVGDAFVGMEETLQMYSEMGSPSNIGLLEVDPPYAIDLHEQKKGEHNVDREYREIHTDEYPDWLNSLTEKLYELAARDAWVIFWFGPTWFCEVKAALISAGFAVDDIPGIWAKGIGQTMAPETNLGRAYEPFFIARKGSPKLNRPGTLNVFNYSPVPPSDKWHPTQRPLGLVQDLLETFALPGTVCCSPFLGSGTTLLGAYNCKMAAFGWDTSQQHKDRFLLEVEAMFRGAQEDEVLAEESNA